MPNDFLPQRGGYKKLRVYKVTEIIYDLTYYFAHKYLEKGDRTIDQMVQAARSGKQNIAEGSEASSTSRETESLPTWLRLVSKNCLSIMKTFCAFVDWNNGNLAIRGLSACAYTPRVRGWQ